MYFCSRIDFILCFGQKEEKKGNKEITKIRNR